MYIFITGCAKSGTTLLQRLFNYYKRTKVIPGEISIDNLVSNKHKGKIIVGKRVWSTVLSSSIDDNSLIHQIKKIKDNNVKIVNIVRDGRDVVISDNNWVKPDRWIYTIKQRNELSDIVTAEIRYEDLVENPDEIQDYLSKKLGLEKKYNFSEYPKHLKHEDFSHLRGNDLYKARPINKSSINKDLHKYKSLCNSEQIVEFDKLLKELGYI